MKDFTRASLDLGTFEEFKKKNEHIMPNFSDEEIQFQYDRLGRDLVFINDKYQVNIDMFSHASTPFGIPLIHMIIKRIDGEEVSHWRDVQDIKNIMLGEDIEAVELYPMESRNVPEIKNQTHLWCMPAGQVFPVGFFEDEPKPFLKIVK